jgi:N-formylmaleamate deformylase
VLRYTEGDLSIKGVKIHYYRTGGGKPPVILLHGATDNGLCWTPTAEVLCEKYDVIMPDAQGHGQSERLTPDFKSRDLFDQVFLLGQQLGLDRPFIMGHSMGASTAVNVAAEYPDFPRAIILEDPGWNTRETLQSMSPERKKKQREGFTSFLTGFGKKTLQETIDDCRRANPGWLEAEIGPWAESKFQFDTGLFTRLDFERPSYTEQVPKIRCSALLIISDGGVVTAKTAEQAAAQLWKSSRPFHWIQIKEAGHNIRRDQFTQYCEAVLKFMHTVE